MAMLARIKRDHGSMDSKLVKAVTCGIISARTNHGAVPRRIDSEMVNIHFRHQQQGNALPCRPRPSLRIRGGFQIPASAFITHPPWHDSRTDCDPDVMAA
ncbi:unnamed protein product [Periconia digitata]|uniref:Uncharacterized protein n=1 Tax=Periconia digitata TaxID=1303443 RepID=A0A9W4UEB0_9PLEO|nr:unnamed protein product [Periconia digitata]